MLSLLLLAEATSLAPAPKPLSARTTARVTASVRIERVQPVTSGEWSHLPPAARREFELVDEAGQKILVRVVEHQ